MLLNRFEKPYTSCFPTEQRTPSHGMTICIIEKTRFNKHSNKNYRVPIVF